jgi:hypothetical protein
MCPISVSVPCHTATRKIYAKKRTRKPLSYARGTAERCFLFDFLSTWDDENVFSLYTTYTTMMHLTKVPA